VQSEVSLISIAGDFGQVITPEQADHVERFFDLLLLWNRRINLTGARSKEALVAEHFPDSLALSALVPRGLSLLDVGSGGGLPAIPFALLRPDVRLTLLEPRSRRVAFLRAALRALAVPAAVDHRRLERVPEMFDVLSARAVFRPAEWVQSAAPRVAPGGRIIVFLPEADAWQPDTAYPVADRVSYQARNRKRLALALTVPRGT
jgi:16S rRNA (guanine527-N7)-methyltransferase